MSEARTAATAEMRKAAGDEPASAPIADDLVHTAPERSRERALARSCARDLHERSRPRANRREGPTRVNDSADREDRVDGAVSHPNTHRSIS
jgi:hypothetical protein